MTNADRHEPASRTLDRAVRGAAVRPRRASPFPARRSTRRSRRRARRSTRSPPIPSRRPSPIRSRRSSAAGAASTRWRASFSIWPAPTPMTNCRRSSAKSRPSSRAIAARPISTRRCSSASTRLKPTSTSSGFRPNRRACSSAIISISPAPARARPPEAKARLAAIAERLATLAAAVRPECAQGRERLAHAAGRGRSRRPAGFLRRQRRARRRRPRPSRQVCDHAVALERRAVPAILGAPRSARDGLSRLGGARRERRRDRQSRHRRRNGAPESRARAAARLRDLRPLPPRRHDGEDAASGARSARVGLDAGRRRARARTRRRCRRSPRARAAISRSRPGTGATWRKSGARPSSTSTRASSSPICSSTA